MKYNWDKMTEQQKIKACQQEMELATHNGTTKDDLLNLLRWLWDKFEVAEAHVIHGKWIMDTDPKDGDCRCSNCHTCIDALHERNHATLKVLGYKPHTYYEYCPKCGAKMGV